MDDFLPDGIRDATACAQARELLSVVADDEATDDERTRLELHLAVCEHCAGLAARLAGLDRVLRIRAAEPVPDLVGAVMERAHPAVLGRGGWMRPALAWVAAVLFAQNAAALFLGRLDGAEAHLARHVGAFGVALAVGFVYVAWRPSRAFGLLPFASALVVTTFTSAALDLASGGRTPLAESVHLTELVGLMLLWSIAGSPGWHRPVRNLPLNRKGAARKVSLSPGPAWTDER